MVTSRLLLKKLIESVPNRRRLHFHVGGDIVQLTTTGCKETRREKQISHPGTQETKVGNLVNR